MGRVLIVQLSDIHVRGETDQILSRSAAIVDSVKNLDYHVELAIIAVTGDLAYSGSEVQFIAVWEFLESVRKLLSSALSNESRQIETFLVAIPGNHDCDFSEPSTVRQMLLQGISSDPSKATDQTVVEKCTEVQVNFFGALDAFGVPGLGNSLPECHPRLGYEYLFRTNSFNLRILCFNTAWLSERHEVQGTLLVPPQVVPSNRDPNDAAVIAMFHHPYNWLRAEVARQFRRRIENIADLVMTGHEHDAEIRTQSVATGERNVYIEGGALQAADESERGSFNAFVLDLEHRKQKHVRLEWDVDRYSPLGATDESGDAFGLTWEDFQVTRLKQREEFELSEGMRAWIEEPGATLVHKNRGSLKLSDIFIYPDLQEAVFPSEEGGRFVRSNSVPGVIAESSRLLILGEREAGKTTLCKRAYADLISGGYVPIVIMPSMRPPTGDRLQNFIVKQFAEQYNATSVPAYQQLDRSRRAILIDDYHLLRLNSDQRRKLVETATDFAGKVILFSDTLAQEANDLFSPTTRPDSVRPFSSFRIMPFGHQRRNDLVEKWLLLDDGESINPTIYAYRREDIIRVLDALTGRNFLPPHPVYILAVLMGAEAVNPTSSQVSTYGAYYEVFIRAALARGRDPVRSAAMLTYLSHLAYRMFRQGQKELSDAQYQSIHEEYERRFDVRMEARQVSRDLHECGIFTVAGDSIKFRHDYVYYYFCASWIRDHIGEPEIRKLISLLTRRLYTDPYSNILLFLVHLSKDPFILSELLDAARAIHPQVPPAAFGDDVKFLSAIDAEHGISEYEEQDVEANRRKALEIADERRNEDLDDGGYFLPPVWEEGKEELDPASELVAAAKTVEILGQILRNFPGSLEGDTKLEIASECYALGLRSISTFYESLREVESELVEALTDSVRQAHPGLTELDVAQRARNAIVKLAEALGAVLVGHISRAVGSPELETTYRRLETVNSVPSVQLINLNVRMNYSSEFPQATVTELSREFKTNSFARSILQMLVVMHFHLFPVPTRVKQSVCASIGVKYAPSIGANPARQLMSRN